MNTEITTVDGIWRAGQDDPYFQGHFPGQPILPAVATVHHTFQFLKKELASPHLHLIEVKSAKFASPIPPNTQVKTQGSQTKPNEWQLELSEEGTDRELASLHFIVKG
jgi:3-hydroxymyristoyl/3-hydroxydecanoyl-(acyl carrier protein) dehydratase